MPCIMINGRPHCSDPPIQPAETTKPPIDLSSADDLLSGMSGANISNDLVSTTTTDFDWSEGEQLIAMGNSNEYIYPLGSVSDNATFDTLIESKEDSIALAENTVTVDLNTDSTFL